VTSQQEAPVATTTAAGKSESVIRHWPSSGKLVPNALLGFSPKCPAHCGTFSPDRSAQHHLLGLARFTSAKINAFAKAHFGTGGAQPPAHSAR
jgi:hypothetical protein